MESYHICGGIPLKGEYRVKGAKNSALPIMAATACNAGVYALHGCPAIDDVLAMERILLSLGAKISHERDTVTIDSRLISNNSISAEMMRQMRSSVFMLGSLLTRCGEARICKPGGCRIGSRPIDIHIDGLRALGFCIENDGEVYSCSGSCKGGELTLPYPSVGATENLVIAALRGSGDTIIHNCAREPEIVDLAAFLQVCGFSVRGAGSGTIAVRGKGAPGGSDAEYFIMEDRIEAATYMSAVLGSGGHAVFRNIRAEHMQSVLDVFGRMGAKIKVYEDTIELYASAGLSSAGIVVTTPYPGFPTDCQPQLMSLAATAEGLTTIREEIFEGRFTHKKELVKMGANIEICGRNAIIRGVSELNGCELEAYDLRGGAALVVAALTAQGESTVRNIKHISRGYEDFDKGISSLGGRIERQKCEEAKKKDEPVF